ncbi:hypothetical protein ACODNH_01620 (plasmid) [Haloarcula sp. NS06]|uniref:hypothetical protein n=1 Tax=Haloarcula sp. NS06 TaxID=3409688 RepID=UPI003DA74775
MYKVISPGNTVVYIFGDNHTHPREEVKDRLHSVIPADAEALVMEHCEKAESDKDLSQWVVLKNPSLVLIQLLVLWWQKRKRSKSNRVTGGNQTTVAEEVAEEHDLEMEYTDISWLQRINYQPLYLTLISWFTVLTLFLGWVIHPLLSILSVVLIPGTALLSSKVYKKARDQRMAEDLTRFGEEYAELVFFAGDRHIDSVAELLDGEFEIIEESYVFSPDELRHYLVTGDQSGAYVPSARANWISPGMVSARRPSR